LASWAAGYGLWLADRGFAPSTVSRRLGQFARLDRWLEREGLSVGELTAERVEEFSGALRAAGYVSWVTPRCLTLPLEYLREAGVVPPAAARVGTAGPVEELLAGWRRYLVCERGLAERSCVRYERDARPFLAELVDRYGSGLGELDAADVNGFLTRECPRRSAVGTRNLVVALRSLLRYLHVAGVTAVPLVWALPRVAARPDRSLPRGLEPAMLARLLASCDRRRTLGRRNYAILLLLARLGLRAGEVAALALDDVDWRAGEVSIRGKGDRHDRLPLPADVGQALVDYLRRRRGPAACRTLFLGVLAPIGPLSGGAISMVVRDACVRAGIPPAGAHRLRHTAATGMLREGASLTEIAQVLRHSRIETAAIYAKIDHLALRALAPVWPGGETA
jgi:integrase/recombinase XerD